MKARSKTITYFLAAWLFIAVLAAVQFLPRVPLSFVALVLLILFGPVLYVGGEFVSEWLWSFGVGRRISQHASVAVRIGVGVTVGAFVLACSLWLFSLVP